MKRGGPLKRKTALKPGGGLRNGGQLRRTGRLPAMSAKRKAVQGQRAQLVRDQLALRPYCEVRWSRWLCEVFAVQLHEPLTRARGGSILDPANTIATCWACHRAIHTFPAEATARGFLRSAS